MHRHAAVFLLFLSGRGGGGVGVEEGESRNRCLTHVSSVYSEFNRTI